VERISSNVGTIKVGIISDTHSYMDERILSFLDDVDEIWHAGDVGEANVLNALSRKAKLKVVYGNIDDHNLRAEYPENLIFTIKGVKIFMTHIGGYPGKYSARVKQIIETENPNLFICGHSHITKIMPDKKHNLLHINPGAAGRHGFHHIRTIVTLEFSKGGMQNLKVIELGKRSAL